MSGVHAKEGYDYTGMAPNIVVLDPAMTIGTPSRLWFGTGMRAIDHAVETWCSPSTLRPFRTLHHFMQHGS